MTFFTNIKPNQAIIIPQFYARNRQSSHENDIARAKSCPATFIICCCCGDPVGCKEQTVEVKTKHNYKIE